jgi:hypothetical protein
MQALKEILVALTMSASAATTPTIPQMIDHYAEEFHIDPITMHATIKCESDYNNGARGKAGEIGLAQFMPRTFAHYSKLAPIDNPNIYSPEHQIITMAYMWSIGEENQWTCFRDYAKAKDTQN